MPFIPHAGEAAASTMVMQLHCQNLDPDDDDGCMSVEVVTEEVVRR